MQANQLTTKYRKLTTLNLKIDGRFFDELKSILHVEKILYIPFKWIIIHKIKKCLIENLKNWLEVVLNIIKYARKSVHVLYVFVMKKLCITVH